MCLWQWPHAYASLFKISPFNHIPQIFDSGKRLFIELRTQNPHTGRIFFLRLLVWSLMIEILELEWKVYIPPGSLFKSLRATHKMPATTRRIPWWVTTSPWAPSWKRRASRPIWISRSELAISQSGATLWRSPPKSPFKKSKERKSVQGWHWTLFKSSYIKTCSNRCAGMILY